MKELFKYDLDYEKTFPFVTDSLEETNALSIEVLKLIDVKKGSFFTLLPEDANLERLYEFKSGVILPQNPLIRHKNSNSYYSVTPTIREELSLLIKEKIISNESLISIFDDVFIEKPRRSLPESLLYFHYEKEIYYIGTKSNVSIELIKSYMRASNAFWHSLCVLTKLDIESIEDGTLYLDDIEKICLNTELIIVGAYDGEGYIFWEKNEGFFP